MSETGWKFLALNAGASVTPLVAGVAGKKIRVLAMLADANNGSATWKFQTSTGPVDLTGNLFVSSGPSGSATATGSFVLPHSPTGWFETLVGDDLNLVLLAGSAGLCGCLVYEEA